MCTGKCMSQGIIAGLFAGIIFSFFLILGGMTASVGNIIGMPNELGAMIIHLIISMLAGLVFVLLFNRLIHSWTLACLLGILFGLGMWIIGPMTLLPTLSAGDVLFSHWNQVGFQASKHLLIGHLVYGLALGLAYYFLKKGKLHKLKK